MRDESIPELISQLRTTSIDSWAGAKRSTILSPFSKARHSSLASTHLLSGPMFSIKLTSRTGDLHQNVITEMQIGFR